MPRGSKRKQDVPASAPPAVLQRGDAAADASSSRSSRSRPSADLNEDALANAVGNVPHADPNVDKALALSTWEQYDTILILYWLKDFDGMKIPPNKEQDRVFLLKKAISTKGLTTPKGLKELQENFLAIADGPAVLQIVQERGMPGWHKSEAPPGLGQLASSSPLCRRRLLLGGSRCRRLIAGRKGSAVLDGGRAQLRYSPTPHRRGVHAARRLLARGAPCPRADRRRSQLPALHFPFSRKGQDESCLPELLLPQRCPDE